MGLYTRRQLLLLFGLAVAAGLGLAIGHWRAHHPAVVERLESLDRAALPPAPSREPVARPAPTVPASGSPVADGEFGPAPARPPEPGDIRLAARAADRPARPSKLNDSPAGEAAPRPLDVNRASLEDLTRLPGIGPALASRIVEARQAEGPFTHVDDLRRVRGVGPSKLERLRAYVTAGE